MPEADVFEAPQNATFHGELLETLTEAFVGNGVLADGEAYVSADAGTAMGIDVSAASTGIVYGGTIYTPTAASFTLSTGPTTTTGGQDDRRVDLVHLDTSAGAFAVTEGTADPNPVPPDTPTGDLLIALIEVPNAATDIADANILNWRARPVSGTVGPSGEAQFDAGMRVGPNPATVITEAASPTGFGFSADEGVDVWLEAAVDVSNNSGASATEDVTLTLYDGTDATGTQVGTDTQSVTLADAASTTLTLLTTDFKLDGGDYFVEVTTSGTDISVDEVRASTQGLEWSFVENDDGTLDLVNRYTSSKIFSVDPFTDEISFLNAAIDEPEIADGSITTLKIADDAVTVAKIAADAVGTAQIQTDAVTETEIGDIASGFTGAANAGSFGALFDFPVDNTPTDGTLQSFTFAIDGNNLIQFRALADGAGGVDTLELRLLTSLNTNGNDLEDDGTTIWSSTDGHIPRPQVDDAIARSSTKTAAYTTTDEEYVPVDPSGTGGVTITLASADVTAGNEIIVKDVGGSASSNPITVVTEGTETIDASVSTTIDVDYGSVIVVGDGTNWDLEKAASRTVDPRDIFEGTETGAVANGDQGILTVDSLADGETVEIYKAVLTTDTIQAIPSGVDLELVTFDNAGSFTSRSTLVTGDGTTIHDRVTGNPLASYTNSSGAEQSVGVLVDNGSGASVDVVARIEGTAPA